VQGKEFLDRKGAVEVRVKSCVKLGKECEERSSSTVLPVIV
jgi:hypothetical protein